MMNTAVMPENYYYYHLFSMGKIGFLFNHDGLKEIDISALNDDVTSDVSSMTHHSAWFERAVDLSSGKASVCDAVSHILHAIILEFTEYFAGKRSIFTIPLVPKGTDFQKTVWQELVKIPYGTVISYKELAAKISNPKAMRAVGSANGKNPLPIIIPCHRVIQGDQTLGGYSGGLKVKMQLLTLEGLSLIAGKRGVIVAQGQSDLSLE